MRQSNEVMLPQVFYTFRLEGVAALIEGFTGGIVVNVGATPAYCKRRNA